MGLLGPGPRAHGIWGPLALIMQFSGEWVEATWQKSRCKTRHLSLLKILPSKMFWLMMIQVL